MFNKSNKFKKRILFIGIPDMAYICLDGLLMSGFNIVSVIGPKQNHDTYNNFKNFVTARNLPLIDFEDLSEPEFLNKIKNLKIDVAVVCSFNYKIPKVLLDLAPD